MGDPAAAGDGSSVRAWHSYDWEEVIAGRQSAGRYFVRSGLVRKDKLIGFVPAGCHPPSAIVKTFRELQAGLRALGCGKQPQTKEVRYVLKKAHSSNAYGIRFLTEREALALLQVMHFPGSFAHAARVASAALLCFLGSALFHRKRSSGTWPKAVLLLCGLGMVVGCAVRQRRRWQDLASWKTHELVQHRPADEKLQVWVLQRSIEPYLHDGRKFHLRALLLCVGDLTAHVHSDVRMLMATTAYREGSEDSMRADVHITNMGANSAVSGYSEEAQNVGLQMLGEELAEKVFNQVLKVLGGTLANLRAAGRRHFFALPNCWELFGADFLIDCDGSAILLEVNPSPSLAMYGKGASVQDLVGPDPFGDLSTACVFRACGRRAVEARHCRKMDQESLVSIVDGLLSKHHQRLLMQMEHLLDRRRQIGSIISSQGSDLLGPPPLVVPLPPGAESEHLTDGKECQERPSQEDVSQRPTLASRLSSSLVVRDASLDRSGSYELAKEASKRIRDSLPSESPELPVIGLGRLWRMQRRLLELASSWQFEAFFATVIATNSVFIGVTIQWESAQRTLKVPSTMFAVQLVYTLIFLSEVLLKLCAFGPREFFCSVNWGWNWFDVFVVTSAVFECFVEVATQDPQLSGSSSNLRILRVLRMTRLTRIFRVIRVVRFFRSLRTLVFSIANTLKSLFWAMLLLALIMYVFGIVFTDIVNNHILETDSVETIGDLEKYFGTLHISVQTLFMSISGGLTWQDASGALSNISWLWVYVFTSYVAFSCFAVLNVMTGVFCQSAIKGAERDQEMVVQSLIMDKQQLKQSLTKLFQKMDDEGNGSLTLSHFEKHFQDEEVKVLFEALELGATDAWTLFLSLDHNEDYQILPEEFLEGCLRLRGTAKAIDVYMLRRQISKLGMQMCETACTQEHLAQMLGNIQHVVDQDRTCRSGAETPNS
ncbi:putative tubulin--tyrosine ligase C12B10.04 [Symbiodinium microadriaticum]|uniref:Putative tubulin--tyrosine ligase C12B10.04 n=1 Tax=Symbiodinium microadriaticum TaxID=2951 RepID=A0A1Q9DVL2_SYMMI|nr:putative tubulin--tyrosine ligase C12B10.04 [Symbiodinium microadriaticum]CAE6911260.1 unnamed protein product [Symbiodinium sp. KB8]